MGLGVYGGRDQYRNNTIFAGNLSHYAAFAINDHGSNLKPTTDIPPRYLLQVGTPVSMPLENNSGSEKPKVIANLLLASNGATTIDAKSAALRTPEDGKRFHEIRKMVKAILIGGNTFRQEPYSKTEMPVLVSSSRLKDSQSSNVSANVFVMNLNPAALIEQALEKFGSPVLVEGGPKFLAPLIAKQAIDQLFISRVPKAGNGNYFDLENLIKHYQLLSKQNANNTIFETWVPILKPN